MALFSSCHFLEIEKIGKSDIETYFAEVSSLRPAMNGVYNLYYSFYDRYFAPYAACASDELKFANTSSTFFLFHNFESSSKDETTAVGYIWKIGYSTISNANQIIDHAPKLAAEHPENAIMIHNIMAEALFIRAITHFQICLVYAHNYTYTTDASHLGVPVIRYIPALNATISRNSVQEVYSAIIEDLNSAIGYFSDDWNTSRYYASKTAARALLARVYLYMGNWSAAADYATAVIQTSELSLTPAEKYWKMFESNVELGKEAIFRINGFKQSTGLPSLYYYESPDARPAETFKTLYGTDDVRDAFSCSINAKTYTELVLKYTFTDDSVTDKELRYCNPFILRLSEMYLIRAEALNNSGRNNEAAEDLKRIIARALEINIGEIELSWTTQEELDTLIQKERVKELCFESHRFFDLTRRHESLVRDKKTTSYVRTLEYPDYRMILQIPYVEMDANRAMIQNPTSN